MFAEPSDHHQLGPGALLGHFRILQVLGTGGMGVVYKARDTKLGRLVALKVLSDDLFDRQTAQERFLREAQLAAHIFHPNVAVVHEVSEERGTPFIAMELVTGKTVRDLLMEKGPLSVPVVISIAVQTCDALEAAHREGVIHRDIKSSNIMVTADGTVKVLDFGLAKAFLSDAEATKERVQFCEPSLADRPADPPHSSRTDVLLGTPAYMSPEQASGETVDPRTDVFSLGVVMYEALTGALPFRGGSDQQVLEAVLRRDPSPVHTLRPEIPRKLSRILERCLAKEPKGRHPSIRRLREELRSVERPWSSGRRVSGLTRSLVASLSRPTWFRTWIALVVLSAALLFFGQVLERTPGSGELFQEDQARWVMVAGFDNRTGDDDFDGTLQEVVSVGLDQSSEYKVVGRSRFLELLQQMGVDVDAEDGSVDTSLAREACLRGGIPILVTGHLSRLGESYIVIAELLEVSSGKELATFQERAAGKAQLLPALDRLTASIRRRTEQSGPRLPAPAQQPGELWTSASWDALRLYSEAVDRHAVRDYSGAIARLMEAVRLDPDFAMAHARLGRIYWALGDRSASRRFFRKALERLDRLTPKEQEIIQSEYELASIDYGKAASRLQLLAARHPVDPDLQEALGRAQWLQGDYAAASASLSRAIELSPTAPAPPGLRYEKENVLLYLGDEDAAEVELERFHEANPGDTGWRYGEGYLALMKERPKLALEQFGALIESSEPAVRMRGFLHLAQAHAMRGDYGSASSALAEMFRLARSNDHPNSAVEANLLRAGLELERGRSSMVRELVMEVVPEMADEYFLAEAGRLLARAGFLEEARRALARLEEQATDPPSPTVERLLLEVRGEIALAAGDRSGAARLMERAVSSSTSPPWSEPLARCLLLSGQLDRAAAEYERIREHTGAVIMLPMDMGGRGLGAMIYMNAKLSLAQILESRGQAARARELYREYLRVRQQADTDIPGPAAAREALATLARN